MRCGSRWLQIKDRALLRQGVETGQSQDGGSRRSTVQRSSLVTEGQAASRWSQQHGGALCILNEDWLLMGEGSSFRSDWGAPAAQPPAAPPGTSDRRAPPSRLPTGRFEGRASAVTFSGTFGGFSLTPPSRSARNKVLTPAHFCSFLRSHPLRVSSLILMQLKQQPSPPASFPGGDPQTPEGGCLDSPFEFQ